MENILSQIQNDWRKSLRLYRQYGEAQAEYQRMIQIPSKWSQGQQEMARKNINDLWDRYIALAKKWGVNP